MYMQYIYRAGKEFLSSEEVKCKKLKRNKKIPSKKTLQVEAGNTSSHCGISTAISDFQCI